MWCVVPISSWSKCSKMHLQWLDGLYYYLTTFTPIFRYTGHWWGVTRDTRHSTVERNSITCASIPQRDKCSSSGAHRTLRVPFARYSSEFATKQHLALSTLCCVRTLCITRYEFDVMNLFNLFNFKYSKDAL